VAISLDKVQAKAPELVSLVKQADSALGRYGLGGEIAAAALCLDYSGSMHRRYKSGEVQALAEKALALATRFDDDGAIDVFAFDSSAVYLGQLTLDDYKGGIDRLLKGRRMGTTNYAAAFTLVNSHFGFGSDPVMQKKGLFGLRKQPAQPAQPAQVQAPTTVPVFTIFVTDGAPNSTGQAADAMRAISGNPIFWKFLSVGSESISFLERLDDLTGRVVDNANYQPVGEVSWLSDDRLFDLLLEEYPDWLRAVRAKGILA
jgi:hypothetical protein